MTLFKFSEPTFQIFGFKAGWNNLIHNHFKLGAKKTFGKIAQPVNSFTRFPEYHIFHEAIMNHMATTSFDNPPLVLDVGSPKLFGLHLACELPIKLFCTDITPRNIDEYVIMWKALERGATGDIKFEIADARNLEYPENSFDIVYSMSVLEHIEGETADTSGLNEIARVLKPGGLLVFSVPIGSRHQDQMRPLSGPDHVSDAGDRDSFFQRIYSVDSARKRLIEPIMPLTTDHESRIITRKPGRLLEKYLTLEQNARGLLGFLNPLLSLFYNREIPYQSPDITSRYGPRHRLDDIYGDLIQNCRKQVEAC